MTIARQFFTLVAIPFVLLIAFAISLTYRLANLSADGARLIEDLQRATILNQHLTQGNAELSDELERQLERVDPAFPETFRQLNYRLGEGYIEYLRLDIDQRERLAVENVKSLQDELSIVSMQVFDLLRAGSTPAASARLHAVRRLETRIREGFTRLNALQVGRLQSVVTRLNESARNGFIGVVGLLAALLAVMAGSTALMRRRIQRPLHALLSASERIREGDLSARAPVGRRQDEFSVLTHRFNFMAATLAEHQADLERKVEERTRELQEVQQQLVRAEKMSAVGVLVSGVAHELNNPLATIMGFVELARLDLVATGANPRTLEHLAELDSQVERCRRIVKSLLQFARQQEPHLEAVPVNSLVDRVLRLREYELQTRNTTVVRELDPANPLIAADPDKLQQVVLNLLNNAHDAIAEIGRPGTIWVRTRLDGGWLRLEVADDGAGFREPGRAFDPFYTTKPPGSGTGLGLSVCYGIVQEHHGDITAKNWERGAVIAVTLPVGDVSGLAGPAPGPAPEAAVRRESGEPRALVVDDEESLLRLQASFLGRMGVSATCVPTGEAARQHLEQYDVDVIVSDVRMPGALDGIGLYQWASAFRPHLAQRFVFVSGDLVGLNMGEFFARERVPCIEKPFRFDEYRRTVGDILTSGARQT